MNYRTASLPVLSLVIPAAVAVADNEIIGTVEMSLDGSEQTWYVLDPGPGMLPTAMWLAMGPDHGALSIAAYEKPDLEFVRDQATGAAVPAGDAAVLMLSIGFPVDADEQDHSFPLQSPDAMASVLLLRNWSDPGQGYDMRFGPGRIYLTDIHVDVAGLSSFAGTFSGVLRNDADETMTVENGNIDVEGVPLFSGPPR